MRTHLWRGLRKRCPHCGRGPLFRGGIKLRDRCSECAIKLVRDQGDPYGFFVFLDRALFIFPIVVVGYFRLLGVNLVALTLFVAVDVLLLIVTTPHRFGFCVALDYLVRVRWPDPADDLPPRRPDDVDS